MPENNLQIPSLQARTNWFSDWGKHYISAIFWIVAVVVFANSQILSDLVLGWINNTKVSFFDSYVEYQKSWTNIFSNSGFFAFAVVDCMQVYHRNAPKWIIWLWLSAAVCILLIPILTNGYVNWRNGINGQDSKPCYTPLFAGIYVLSIIYYLVLYVTRAETKRHIRYQKNNEK